MPTEIPNTPVKLIYFNHCTHNNLFHRQNTHTHAHPHTSTRFYILPIYNTVTYPTSPTSPCIATSLSQQAISSTKHTSNHPHTSTTFYALPIYMIHPRYITQSPNQNRQRRFALQQLKPVVNTSHSKHVSTIK